MSAKTPRARPLSPDERRESILDAAVPLFMASGADVTTRQIADAAGIAEGTIFRVFDDKDALIEAAVARFMDPAPTIAKINAIHPGLSLDEAVVELVEILRDKIQGVFGIISAVGMRKPPQHPHPKDPAELCATNVLARYPELLAVEPEVAVQLLRAAVFGMSIAPLTGDRPIGSHELANIIVHGIAKG